MEQPLSPKEKIAFDKVNESIRFGGERYEVDVPWKHERSEFITWHMKIIYVNSGVKNYMKEDHRRALHRYRGGQRFESRTSLNFFFSGFLFATAKVAYITAVIFLHIILHSAVRIYDFHLFITSSSSFHLFITTQ